MIAHREARLRALFQRLLVLSAAASPAACSTSEGVGSADTGAPPADATQSGNPDATQPSGSGSDATQPSGSDGTTATTDAGDATTDATTGLDADPYGFADAACDPHFLDGADDGNGCVFFEGLPCGLPPEASTEKCYLSIAQCAVLCNQQATLSRVCGVAECLVVDGSTIPSDVPLTLECATGKFSCGPGVGRRPEGLVGAPPARRGSAVGASLAEAARLEAASVHAFRRLGSELASMRAPRELVRGAERAARDEIRHARVTSRLARRRGAIPARVAIDRKCDARSIEAFAIENAVEGCVRECFGALVATRQGTHARDPELAREMARIARDETRHAALAWEVARWVSPRLDADARARVQSAMREALATLRREVATTSPDVARELGLPTGDEAQALVDTFAAALS